MPRTAAPVQDIENPLQAANSGRYPPSRPIAEPYAAPTEQPRSRTEARQPRPVPGGRELPQGWIVKQTPSVKPVVYGAPGSRDQYCA